MASTSSGPVTPTKQIISQFSTSTPSLEKLDEIDCTPTTKAKMLSLKRKASEKLSAASPTFTITSFLTWRLTVVHDLLSIRESEKQAITEGKSLFEGNEKLKLEWARKVRVDEKNLVDEKALLMSSMKVVGEDLSDIIERADQITEAYVQELRISLGDASTESKLPALKAARLDRKGFHKKVDKYLGTRKITDDGIESKWCNILGFWLPSDYTKCAHIVPYSWDSKHLAHMFGGDEAPLQSQRNGLSLQKKLEEGFDNSWFTIVPLNTIDKNPVDWKVVLLNNSVKDHTFFTDSLNITGQHIWRWRDIDGKKLRFLNDNRPARRFLYLRYTLAWLLAAENNWPDFKSKVPPGSVWASPNKPEGYLRKSILLELGKRTGDQLPRDLMKVGAFEDPSTSSSAADSVAAMRIVEKVQDYMGGERDQREDEEDESEEGVMEV